MTSERNQLAVTIKRMSISSFDSANSNASPVSSQSRLSNSKEELESDVVTTDLSEQNVILFTFKPAASEASSLSLKPGNKCER